MHARLGEVHLFALLADDTFHDGLPNVVLEAMALGRPVILSPVPAAKEAIRHGETGFVLSAIDAVEEFADICVRLIAIPQRLSSLGAEAAKFAKDHFERGPWLDKLCALFARQSEGSPVAVSRSS
jgi:glycosyltransferase involved in cell wall biosynthesis